MATPKQFDFDKIYDQLIEEGGKSHLLYVNGIRTLDFEFNRDLNLLDAQWKIRNNKWAQDASGFRGSIQLDDRYLNSSGGKDFVDLASFATDFLFNMALDSIKWKDTFKDSKRYKDANDSGLDLGEFLGSVLDTVKNAFDLFENFKDAYKLVESFVNVFAGGGSAVDLFRDDDFTAKAIKFLQEFLPTPLDTAINSLFDSLNPDLKEALKQFWYADIAPSQDVNSLWVPQTSEWLVTPNNSLILVGHSQGNFFLEDGLKEMGGSANADLIRVLAMGSPTRVSSSNLV
ncbi:hypothetical protein [Microcoleus vaginatus]|uniref:hypothetical protein n=1 Tax=Microcoleus vaginatus TaxID=119532 RepID=UPI0032A18A13